MSKINILFIIPTLSPGGAERQLIYLLDKIEKSDFNVMLILFKKSGFFEHKIKNKVKIFYIDNYKNILSAIIKIKKIIKLYKIDILHSFLSTANFYGGLVKIFSKKRVKLITSQRGIHHKYFNKWTIIDIFGHKVSDKVVANSNTTRENCRRFLKINKNKIKIIYNGIIDYYKERGKIDKKLIREKLKLKENLPILISVGRMDKLKGCHTLLKIIEKVLKKQKFYFIFIGDGVDMKSIIDEVRLKNLNNYIKFTGNTYDVFKYYEAADIFTLHTYSEGFSNSISEAMIFGLPVITTDIPANRELIENNIDGILVKPGDINNFAKNILNLLKDQKRREELGRNARDKIISKFPLKNMVRNYENLYKELVKK